MRKSFFLNPIAIWLIQATHHDLILQIAYLKAENALLKSKISHQIRLSDSERSLLLKLGKPLGKTLKDLISIVHYKTFQKWLRNEHLPKKTRAKSGRPKILEAVESIIVKIAEKTGWGYTRILGELGKLGCRVSRTTVINVLERNGFDPGPDRGKDSWHDFVNRHLETLWACDFFVKRAWSMKGFVNVYVLFFIHIKTRKVVVMPSTVQPDKAWIAQQARNFSMVFEDFHPGEEGLLLRDGDFKFTPQFLSILESSGMKSKRISFRSPNLNAFAERWVQSIKTECLDHFVCFGEKHLDYLVKEYVHFYRHQRPHQSMGNVPLDGNIIPFDTGKSPDPTRLQCRSSLGGVLKHFVQAAA